MGGAEKLMLDLLPQLISYENEVVLAVMNPKETPLCRKIEDAGVCIVKMKWLRSYYNPLYIFHFVKLMRNYDIVHTHLSAPQLFAALANVFVCKKMVTTEHSTNNRKRDVKLVTILDKWMYAQYDKIICISDQTEKNLRRYLHVDISDKYKICRIYNGANIKKISSAPSIKDFKKNRFIIVMVAAFRPEKDHKTLVKAMSRLPQDIYEAWLVGDGKCRKQIELMVDELKLNNQIKFWGARMDVPNILKTADVVVTSTHYEGFALSNIEGMAAGKPCIASDVDGIREITEGYGLLVPHQDEASLAGAIRRLHDDRQYYQEIADKCYERAQQFDISKMVRHYNDVYLEVMGE